MTWLTAIQKAPSWPAFTASHQSAYFATWLKSGERTTNFVPLWRASEMKCTSGVRVMFRLEPMTTMYFALYQSALSRDVGLLAPRLRARRAAGRSTSRRS